MAYDGYIVVHTRQYDLTVLQSVCYSTLAKLYVEEGCHESNLKDVESISRLVSRTSCKRSWCFGYYMAKLVFSLGGTQ